MYFKVVITCFVLFIHSNVFAQEFKLGEVSREELEQKSHPDDPDAPAAILFRSGNTSFILDGDRNLYMITKVDTRIKIYTKEGYEYATDKLVYYTGGRRIRAYYSKACTYNLVNGEIDKTKLKEEGEFDEKIVEDFYAKKITLPNVKEGSVIEYRYTIKTPYHTNIRDWHFQYDIPANYVSYKSSIPSCFVFNTLLYGYIDVDKSESKLIRGVTKYNEFTTTYTAKNVKALKEEVFVNNMDNYRSTLKHELALTQFDGEQEKHYSTTWEAVAKKIYEDDDFGKELKRDSYFEDDLSVLLSGLQTPEKKIEVVFNYVKSRMNWNEESRYYCKEGVKKAYENKVGNAAEINLMLTAMLRYAGFDANPVLVSTRSNGIIAYPSMNGFNYVISSVSINDTLILLDATSKYTALGILPKRALNWKGRLIKKDGSNAEIDLLPTKKSLESVIITADLSPEGNILGKTRHTYFDSYAYNFREANKDINEENYIAEIEKNYNNITVSGFTISNVNDVSKPINEQYSFTSSSQVEFIGDKIYFNPLLFHTVEENPFKQEKREYPIDFVFPVLQKKMVIINLPEGYTVASLPEPVNIEMEQNIGRFKYNIAVINNQLQISTLFLINYANIHQEYYYTLKDFYRNMIEKQNEKVVLKKVK
ncbi:DUF3857 domain-containing protein [Flavobacterium arcticum]|uniref:DUF3857 domain-containing protein n=1 Tax=Flavobacterium arcticum TaxID=1784713 RepID=A0A345H9M8_9FLAO|nr:transglutaminase domain-containing protein [Flavobacterium arcticum]AXG73288.1 DUF3857 domain-containing protein [Flavobacterium arcticum]KAF2513083.1 DUF3857 and transglutaminase domain-containing protein [Flavobacterium arcticum]